MAKSLNKAQIIGNAGKDAELRYTNNGKAVARFSVATSDSWKDQGGNMQERTVWHNIVAWDKLGEICANYVKKGTKVYIEGRIENRQYDDKDGVKKNISEIIATDMILLSGNPGERNGSGGSYSQSSPAVGSPMPQPDFDQSIPDADLPF
ncbi:MAG: single-stranded DNA-binding protein [Bacteroidetes bacterium]|nr:single-stranded DNA-binding protein [Bacteroidota bacterium]